MAEQEFRAYIHLLSGEYARGRSGTPFRLSAEINIAIEELMRHAMRELCIATTAFAESRYERPSFEGVAHDFLARSPRNQLRLFARDTTRDSAFVERLREAAPAQVAFGLVPEQYWDKNYRIFELVLVDRRSGTPSFWIDDSIVPEAERHDCGGLLGFNGADLDLLKDVQRHFTCFDRVALFA